YEAHGTPSAVLIASDGTISAPLARGADAIRDLIARATRPPALRPPAVGDEVPAIELEDLDGVRHRLGAPGGHETAVLFWNPGCGFCARMLDDLRAAVQARAAGGPALVVVSRGTIDANRALDLRAPVLLDHKSQAMRAYGVNGTPGAILVDGAGRIARAAAIGADAVLEMLGAKVSVADGRRAG
ncbi:MAG: peroxiredoxin family protein, partial [Steroidobacteraceae bacterium]